MSYNNPGKKCTMLPRHQNVGNQDAGKNKPKRTNVNLKLSKRNRDFAASQHLSSACLNVTQYVAVNRKQIKSSARIRYSAASSN